MWIVMLFFSLAVVVAQGDDNMVEQSVQEVEIPSYPPGDGELRKWSLSLRRHQNSCGNWIDFSLTGDDLNTTVSNDSNMTVKATVFTCKGRKMIRLHATIKNPSYLPANITEDEPPPDDRLRFHKKTADNTAVTNKGLTSMKVDTVKHGVVFSHRPLKPNETFEVKIDKIVPSKNYANAMGVTTYSPDDIELPNHMNLLKDGTWMLYHSQIWHHGSRLEGRYLRRSLDKLKVGDRLGVMRTDKGVLHFFINGADQGPAISGIPENVYGVYEFYGDTSQVTVVRDP